MKLSFVRRTVRRDLFPIESLEGRLLLSATNTTQIPTQSINLSQGASLQLAQYFKDPTVTGTAIEIQTPEGNIPLALTDSKTPKTVQNFVRYIQTGEYNNVLINRLVAGFIFQGGGFQANGTAEPTFAPVRSEAGTSNTTGTIAMALSTGPASGTNQWFINLGNNNGNNPNEPGLNLDNASDGGPFTTFGSVIYNGMSVVNTIAALPVVDDSAQFPQLGASPNNPFSSLPVVNYSGPNPATSVDPSNMLVTNTVVVPALSYSVAVADPTLATATINNGTLTVIPVAGATSGTTNVTVTATDLGGGTATSTFAVNLSSISATTVSIGAGIAKSLTYTDADGTLGTIALTGPGTASVVFSGTGVTQTTNKNGTITVAGTNASITSITTNGTTAKSSLVITTKGGTKTINVGQINTDSLKALTAKGVILTGDVNGTSPIGTFAIAGATGGTISLPSVTSFTATGGVSANITITGSGFSLGKFSAGSITGGTWLLSGNAKSITAGATSNWSPDVTGSITSLTVSKGDLSGTITAGSIGTLHVKGNVNNATITLTGSGKDLTNLSANGQILGSTLKSTGSLGNISAATLTNSNIYAGIATLSSGQVLPNFPSDFASNQSILSVRLKTPHTGDGFFNANIAAQTIGSLSLGTVLTNNGGITTGVAAEHIRSFSAIFAPKHVTLTKLSSATNVATLLSAKGADPGDFVLKLF